MAGSDKSPWQLLFARNYILESISPKSILYSRLWIRRTPWNNCTASPQITQISELGKKPGSQLNSSMH